jgi:hypothetical protein
MESLGQAGVQTILDTLLFQEFLESPPEVWWRTFEIELDPISQPLIW